MEGQLQVLTVQKAKELKGRKIQTIYRGYDNQDGVDSFIVGDLVNSLNYQKALHKADLDYEKKLPLYLSDSLSRTSYLLRKDGSYTSMFSEYNGDMSCTDECHTVFYREIV